MELEKAKTKTILAVDDEVEILELLEARLSNQGYMVLTAENGPAGLKIAKEALPDLVLLDVSMKPIDGFEVLKRLKQDKRTVQIPVIMLTCRSEQADMERGIMNLAEKYIVKPFDEKALLEDIKQSLEYR